MQRIDITRNLTKYINMYLFDIISDYTFTIEYII